jgi:hypothetical protein
MTSRSRNGGIGTSVLMGALALAACSTPTQLDAGVFPVDASICNCASQGDPCGAPWSCCPNLSCVAGACVPNPGTTCAALGEPCNATTVCCVPPAPDGGYPPGAVPPIAGCRTDDAGFSVCYVGAAPGDPCGPPGTWGCTNALVCTGGQCEFAYTGNECPNSDGGPCAQGDGCYGELAMHGIDPCQGWGLQCLPTGNAEIYACQVPAVLHPPEFPLATELGAAYSGCLPSRDLCEGYPGDSAAAVCGSFFAPGSGQPIPDDICVEQCTRGDDCGSLAWDCLNGQCVPNYCYAAPDSVGTDVAAELQAGQGTPVSNVPTDVLYKACTNGGPNTVCLPTYDSNWNTTIGICYRVGGPDAGGIGASCNPNGTRSDLEALCQSGTMCLKGTCLQWCDTSKLGTPCPSTQQCIALNGTLVTSSANPFGVGVCTETCDPYQNAGNNGCPVQGCNLPFKVCKPSGIDNDIFPSPGLCVAGVDAQVAVGQPCNPFVERDPCVSGALCVPAASGSQFVCAQVCDPSPSPGQTPPACPTAQACVGLQPPYCLNSTNRAHGYACHHMGICQ